MVCPPLFARNSNVAGIRQNVGTFQVRSLIEHIAAGGEISRPENVSRGAVDRVYPILFRGHIHDIGVSNPVHHDIGKHQGLRIDCAVHSHRILLMKLRARRRSDGRLRECGLVGVITESSRPALIRREANVVSGSGRAADTLRRNRIREKARTQGHADQDDGTVEYR